MRSPARVCIGMEWDWGNPGLFGRKDAKTSVSIGGRAFSTSELGNGSSRSSISASVDSSKVGGTMVSGFSFEGFSKKVNRITELARAEDTGTSPFAAAGEVGEPLIGLKLGKRTYLEDDCAGNTVKGLSTTLAAAAPSTAAVKKTRASNQIVQSSHCQVEGCDVDLSGAKDYHRKHRVCLTHSKSPKVVVAGQERRFCQQCSRFHDLSEFDQKKRSCRRRLSDHNARRRKPQTDTISFNSSRHYSSFYDEQQMNFILDRAPFGHGRPTASSTWGYSCGFSLTHTKGPSVKSAKAGGVDGQLHFSNSSLSDTVAPLPRDLDKLLRFKGTTTELLNQGLEASVTSTVDGAPDLQRALSLLSTGSWGSANPTQTNLAKFVTSSHSSASHPTVQAVNSMSGFWHNEQPLSQQARVLPLDLHSNGGQYQEFQPFKAPYETTFFDSSQILPKPDGQFLEFKV